MGYNPWDPDDPVQRIVRDMENFRRMAEPSDILTSLKDNNLMLQRDALSETTRQIADAKLGWQLMHDYALQDLEKNLNIWRHLEEDAIQRHLADLNAPSLHLAALMGASTAADVLYGHRQLIDGYILDTFSGGGASLIGASTGYSSLQESNQEFAQAYEQLNEAVDSEEEETPSPAPVKHTIAEAFTSAEVVEELVATAEVRSEEEIEEGTEDRDERRHLREKLQQQSQYQLRGTLEALNPGLVKIWEGSYMALSSSNPDRIRHFSASRRELATHVLHLLAPDKAIRHWNQDASLYNRGKPTRMARLQYICRSIHQDGFQEFVKVDFRLMLDTFDFFQQGTHALESQFTQEQIDAVSTRADQHLLFLIRLGAIQN